MKKFILILALSFSVSIYADFDIDKEIENAKSGDLNSQLLLANSYYSGSNGVTKDFKESEFWYKKCAAGGIAECQYKITLVSYDPSMTSEESNLEKVYWLTKAAESGHALAQYHLGGFFYSGQGVKKDEKKAVELWEKSAKQGCVAAIITLGDRQSGILAIEYYLIAAQKGSNTAQIKLGKLYSRPPDFDQIQAFVWFSIAAESGDSSGVAFKKQLEGKLTKDQIYEANKLISKNNAIISENKRNEKI